MEADLRHIGVWLFDLDNTLYPLESGHMLLVQDKMTDFMERFTGLPRDEARALQKRYYHQHGTTLAGLMAHHGVDPEAFLEEVHDITMDRLTPDPALRAALLRLPGRQMIFTNGSAGHAHRVLRKLEIDDIFEDVFHIAAADYIPKPAPETFEKVVARFGIDPKVTCFFEDSEKNLAPAATLGMTTVLVGPEDPGGVARSGADFVNFRTTDLAAFLAEAQVMETAA